MKIIVKTPLILVSSTNKMTAWLKTSAFSIAWSSADVAIHLFCNDMIQTESSARACAASGNIFRARVEAL